MSPVEVSVVDDPARACAELMVDTCRAGGAIVLAGGSTPKAANGLFVEAVRDGGLDLSSATFWMGDERCVAPGDERSNYRMIKESLIDPLDGAPVVRRMRGELGPADGAADYERTLLEAGDAPRFDLVLLGIGPDGHTASLFPGQATLQERSRLVVGVPEAGLEPFVPRISLTVTALTSAERVVFLASGASKADAIARAFGPDAPADPAVPSSLLAPSARRITVLADAAAAAGLSGGVS
jgi:6-phosphogluconolactonase